MQETRVCSRCVMDSTDASIRFDENGHCNYCAEALIRMPLEYFPNEEGKRRLDEMMRRIKDDARDLPYDCMVGVSGGLDSSYIVHLGYRYGLRMLCVHVDDGLDTEIAKRNIERLCESANAKLVVVRPDTEQYRDVTRSFFLAGVPGLAIPQDNILYSALRDTAKAYRFAYSLAGQNFSMESILQRGENPVNACDKKHILAIQRRFGRMRIDDLPLMTMADRYIGMRYFAGTKTLHPLNYLDYRMDTALSDLEAFCGYTYYGGKHYESVLTRFLQCWYLPTYFNFDKRKSHFSSLIVSGQMTREEALMRLQQPAYATEEMRQADFHTLAAFIDMTDEEFAAMLDRPKHAHTEYPVSVVNKLAPVARKFRRFLG